MVRTDLHKNYLTNPSNSYRTLVQFFLIQFTSYTCFIVRIHVLLFRVYRQVSNFYQKKFHSQTENVLRTLPLLNRL